ncbi:MAG: hypothetical protein VKJ64_02245 [Leptolyngbyaceae bacterium]|nr:hypothetical protein [Leptolyngbyaceae bacterium]
MSPRMIRQVWTLIEKSQPHTLLSLDDNSLVSWIISEMESGRLLNSQEVDLYSRYIRSRLPLIRDMVAAR